MSGQTVTSSLVRNDGLWTVEMSLGQTLSSGREGGGGLRLIPDQRGKVPAAHDGPTRLLEAVIPPF